jgi:hypothetical protein
MPLASRSDRLPTTAAEAVRGRSSPLAVSGKLAVALSGMVWSGLTRREAAERAGMSEHGLYAALRKVHVRQWLKAELAALRASAMAKAVHRLEEIIKTSDNHAAVVAAARELRQADAGEDPSAPSRAVPGLLIQIINNNNDPERIIDGNEHVIGRDDAPSDP